MKRIITYFRNLPKQVSMFAIVVITMVGLWLFITPFYNLVVDTFSVSPLASVIVGLIIVFIAVKLWKMRPW